MRCMQMTLKVDHLEYPVTVFLYQNIRCKIILACSGEPYNICVRDILRNPTETFASGSVILVCEGEARESGDP